MVRTAVVLFALLAGPAVASTVTPVQKVVQLLNGMVEKGKDEKHAEAQQFATYKQFCKDTTFAKQYAIKEGNAMIEQLTADIEDYEATAESLSKQITQLD